MQFLDDIQSPMSDQTGNLASNTGTSRRSSANARRPLSSDEININLVMRMGFSRRTVEMAVRTLSMFAFEFKYLNLLNLLNLIIN